MNLATFVPLVTKVTRESKVTFVTLPKCLWVPKARSWTRVGEKNKDPSSEANSFAVLYSKLATTCAFQTLEIW